MNRKLSLVLNGRENNTMVFSKIISLDLIEMESKELDEYISKNFNSSDEVRKKFATKINSFLEQNKDLLTRVEKETGKKYEGSIVITELHDDLTIQRKKVLYKKDMILFNQITKNKKFILTIENYDYLCSKSAKRNNKNYRRIFSEYYGRELKFHCFNDGKFKKIVGQWRSAMKESYYYYDFVRAILKEYQNRYKGLELDSLDVVYSNYLSKKKEKNTKTLKKDLITSENLNLNDEESKEPTRYPKIYDEDGYPGDLEDHWPESGECDNELLGCFDCDESEELYHSMVKVKKYGYKN